MKFLFFLIILFTANVGAQNRSADCRQVTDLPEIDVMNAALLEINFQQKQLFFPGFTDIKQNHSMICPGNIDITYKKTTLNDYVKAIRNYQKNPMEITRLKVLRGELIFEGDETQQS